MVVRCEIVGRGKCTQLSLVSVLLSAFVSPFSSPREFSGFMPQDQSFQPASVKLSLKLTNAAV